MVEEAVSEGVFEVSQLFVKRNQSDKRILLSAHGTDYFLVYGTLKDTETVLNVPCASFRVDNMIIGQDFNFHGCEVTFEIHRYITLSMDKYRRHLKYSLRSR